MPLPASWVDALFGKLTVAYGQRFLGLYAGLSLDAVKADWGDTLDGLQARPEAIKHALAHLPPDNPPTAMQFRAICRNAPAPAAPRLDAPHALPDPQRMAQALGKLQTTTSASKSGREVALKLARRELWQKQHPSDVSRYDTMTAAQRAFWRTVLGVPDGTRPEDVLPECAAQGVA